MDYFASYGIDISQSLELLGDIETFNEILNDFYAEIEEKLTNLESYKNNNDIENYTILVHALKSECKYLSFDELADLCYNHQMHGEDNDTKYINDNFDDLKSNINKIKDIVGAYLESL